MRYTGAELHLQQPLGAADNAVLNGTDPGKGTVDASVMVVGDFRVTHHR